ncbi:MAG: SpoIIE family protein phosphatase [Deltaproteobacteria bacterium]|nr:SpoIIE family protein phosphatase [Deltaproteobacteria bacterium]
MKNLFRFSISTKLLVVITLILLAVTIPLSFKAADMFKTESSRREENANITFANARASELSVIFKNVHEKASIIGSMMLSPQVNASKQLRDLVRSLFLNDRDMLALNFYQTGEEVKKIHSFVNHTKLEQMGQSEDYLTHLEKTLSFPFQRVINGEVTIENRSLPEGLAILTFGIPLVQDDKGRVSFFVLADVRQSGFEKELHLGSERKSFMVNKAGIILAHPDEKLVLNRSDFSHVDIVKQALESRVLRGQFKYRSAEGAFFYGAFTRTDYGPVVITEIPETVVLEPAFMIRREIYYLTGIILSISLVLIFLFSLTLTRPIIKLSEIAREIGEGKFDIPIKKLVRSSDEVGDLASSVNWMSDKIASLLVQEKAKAEIEKELEIANAVQMTFLSDPSNLAPFNIASFYASASQCGGDWWGHYRVAPEVELLLIGDATGHGVAAALVTAMAYSTSDIFAQKLIQGQDRGSYRPSVILKELNRLLYDCLHGQFCMSFFAAFIDAKNNTVTYANAGHCFPYLIPKDPKDERAIKSGMLLPVRSLRYQQPTDASILGIRDDVSFVDETVQLKKGDRIVFYTDGVTEARSDEGVMWGTKNFLKSVTKHYDNTIKVMCENVIKDLRTYYTKETFEDDATLIVTEYT